jgi:hypothetical protein
MKGKSFYQIHTNLTKEECEEILNGLTSDELQVLHDLNIDAHDEEVNNQITSYVICDKKSFLSIVLFLRQHQIKFEFEDISEDILNSSISFMGTDFEEETIKFIECNTKIDHILDKINRFGIEGISEFDKNFLKNQS